MAFWVSVRRQSNKDVSIKEYKDQGIFGTCDRCGKRFNLQETEDAELLLCQHCFKEVQNNPNDEYLTRRVKHEEHSIQ
jgi:DNA-directed RNA polymerase subunit RPC12/RpoP